jgi:hypothetical protein
MRENIMSTYTAIADAEIDVDSPVTQILLTKYRENMLAIQQGDATAPKVGLPAIVAALASGIGAAIATLEFGQVGSSSLMYNAGAALSPNDTIAGSSLSGTSANGSGAGDATVSGTWRCMGETTTTSAPNRVSQFVRIS